MRGHGGYWCESRLIGGVERCRLFFLRGEEEGCRFFWLLERVVGRCVMIFGKGVVGISYFRGDFDVCVCRFAGNDCDVDKNAKVIRSLNVLWGNQLFYIVLA